MTLDPLTPEERELQSALGTGPVPDPRRTDAAFAAGVLQAHQSRRTMPLWAPLGVAVAAGLALVFIVPDAAPESASGAELYALSLDAWSADTLELPQGAESVFLDDDDEDEGSAQDRATDDEQEEVYEDDLPTLLDDSDAASIAFDDEGMDALDDGVLLALDALLDSELAL